MAKKKELTEQELAVKAEFVEMLDQGATLKELAAKFGKTEQTMRNWAVKFGVEKKLNRGRMFIVCKGKVKETLNEYLDKGMTAPEIAKDLHTSVNTVMKAIESEGLSNKYKKVKSAKMVKSHRNEERHAEWRDELQPMLASGMTVNDIRQKLGLTKRAVYCRMRAAGLESYIREHHMPNDPKTIARQKKIAKLMDQGLPMTKIASRLGESYPNVVRIVGEIKAQRAVEENGN